MDAPFLSAGALRHGVTWADEKTELAACAYPDNVVRNSDLQRHSRGGESVEGDRHKDAAVYPAKDNVATHSGTWRRALCDGRLAPAIVMSRITDPHNTSLFSVAPILDASSKECPTGWPE